MTDLITPELILLLHAVATWYMVGLIWKVQLVHYPGFALIPETSFQAYAQEHVQKTGLVVGPPMLLEAATAALLVLWLPGTWTLIGAALLAIIWLSTALLQVPAHRSLCHEGYDRTTIDRLVATNWIRTAAWSLRGVVAAALIAPALALP